MRYLRHKAIRKALKQYHFLCGIKAPYKVLLDGNFIAMCVQMKVDLMERVPKFLQVKPNECEFYISHASLEELKLLGEEEDKSIMKEALELARTFQIADKNVKAMDVTEAIRQLIGEKNPRKFLVATQEVELRKALRMIPGVPLIYLNRSVLVFEDISRATLAIVRADEKEKREKLDLNEKRKLESIQTTEDKTEEEEEAIRRIKRKAKAPNPLSCKKSIKKKVRAQKKKNC